MSDIGDFSDIAYLQERVTFLEETNRRHMSILDMLASSGDFHGELSRASDVKGIFRATVLQARRLIRCQAAGCLDSMDDGTFELLAFDPADSNGILQQGIDACIMDGSFAWALNRNQAVLIPISSDRTFLMQVIATRSRIRGMFVAILSGGSASVDAAALNALSIILYACAYSQESAALHDLLREHSSHLEERVLQRTVELEESRALAEFANRAKSEFLANMSHEIRTPMNAIMGLTDLILEGGIDEPLQKQYLRMIQESSESLLAIINDLLDISKIESGKMELQESPFELRASLDKFLQPFAIKAAQKDLRVVVSIGEEVPERLLGDEGKVRQVVINLVGNAIKFCSSGDIVVSVALDHCDGSDLSLRFQVSDNGIGIASDVQQRIFDAFEQADSSTSKQFGGTGLGLAICKRLVAMMGGDIGVESQPGQGSRFWFTGRFRRCEQDSRQETDGYQQEQGGAGEPCALQVLLADDVEFNRILATALLERLGHHVVSVANGSEAVNAFAQQRFDIVLMDIQMPLMDGLQASQAIRGIESKTGGHTPIVALTAYASENDRIRCRAAGMDGYLSKPFKAADLRMLLAGHCSESAAAEDSSRESRSGANLVDTRIDVPVFDCADLLSRLGGRQDSIPRFLELFRSGVARQQEELALAAASADSNALRIAAHTIKGAAANIAALRVYALASRLEAYAKDGLVDAAVALIPELREEFSRFEIVSREMYS